MNDRSRPKAAPETVRRPDPTSRVIVQRRIDNPMLVAALDLAASGWRVLPCIPSGPRAKAPLLPPPGHHLATSDPERIRGWWTQWPNAMIGAPVPTTLIVLDVDPRNGGSLDLLEAVTGPLPLTLTVMSGRNDGGLHLYYLRPSGVLASTRLPEGVDLKQSGYLIVPPSIHPVTGLAYWWIDRAPVALPSPALDSLRPIVRHLHRVPAVTGKSRGRQADALVRVVREAPESRRNDLLYWAARRAVEEGHDESLFDDLADAAEVAGLGAIEVARTISSARHAHGGANA